MFILKIWMVQAVFRSLYGIGCPYLYASSRCTSLQCSNFDFLHILYLLHHTTSKYFLLPNSLDTITAKHTENNFSESKEKFEESSIRSREIGLIGPGLVWT